MKFTIFGITLITVIGIILRIIFIDKDGGLWNDEYVSWAIASTPLGKEFIDGILTQCHMPLYYLYLKFFNLFSNDDTYLRLTSLVPSVLSIPVMYIVGREKSKFTGFTCAIFTAFSSLLIYYAQEVRFYSLLFLFSSLSLYFTFRTIKLPRKRNLAGLIISNFLILITHTIGFVYVFFNLIFISFKLRKFYKKFVNVTWITTGITLLIALPLIVKILFLTHSMSQWWANLNIYRILQVFCDYFTPIITNVSVVENINGLDLNSIFLVIPLLIALAVIIGGFFDKNIRYNNQIINVAIATFIIALFASMLGKLSLDAKYIIEIYPILIFVFASTVDSLNNTPVKIVILALFFTFNIGYIVTPTFASKLPRNEGNKYVADLLKSAKLKKGDFIVLTYYPKKRFEKYFDFKNFNVLEIYKGNFNYFYTPFLTSEEALKIGKNKYRGIFLNSVQPLSSYSGSLLIETINNEVYFKMKKNQKVAFVFLDTVSFLDEYTFSAIVSDPKMYKKAALPYLIFSNIRNEIIKTLPINARNLRYEAKGAWTVVTFEY